jgi:hypothetical protein
MILSASSRTRGSLMLAFRALLMAMEWCGIIACMKAGSSISAWLRFAARRTCAHDQRQDENRDLDRFARTSTT